ncbi:DUF1236 domain-containing protein [Devosia sp. PTR5]|uniref:DUF1236 domain-containing protein n=1 Tax=Devosia oryzisoli TaxID=2774138 RepID=A0A927IT76_9HYPH|nr:DUF1236 domain-containing protein [Devosia oryzisoli]MBD8066259.1 DUF1236 domain-containing protein [Devosia oryzisoli]
MKKMLMASVAVLSLGLAAPAFAQDSGTVNADAGAAIGGAGGAAGGATLGFLAGGPIGAVIGGFAGAVIGAEAGVASSTVEYAGNHPVDPIVIDGSVDVGMALPKSVKIYPVEGDPDYGYVYANGRVWIVNMSDRTLVQSPGYVVSQASADYAIANPTTSASVEGDVVVGYVLPDDVELTPVPDNAYYDYVYINDRPALVDAGSRTIVWIK